MKKSHIIAIGMIAIAIGLLISLNGDIDNYSSFAEAEISGEKVTVSGHLSKDKTMNYDPEVDPNYFSFHIKDKSGDERKVVLLAAKPQMQGGEFIASDMLMKCPSKYKDEEVYIKSKT